MNKKEQIQAFPSVSKRESFTLGFEYDKTLQEVKRDVRIRTYKNL